MLENCVFQGIGPSSQICGIEWSIVFLYYPCSVHGLLISWIFSKKQLSVSLIFSIDFLFLISLISTLSLLIYNFLLTVDLICSFFPSFLLTVDNIIYINIPMKYYLLLFTINSIIYISQ